MAKSKSSNKWLREHFDDPYVKQAQQDGFRSRAVYKLLEIDDKDKILDKARVIVDLGAAPGGWSQVAARKLGDRGHIYALDILAMDNLADVSFIQGDFREQAVLDELLAAIGEHKADLVMSDMAPNISGMKAVDQPKAMYLAELALDLARQVGAPGSDFLVKVFQGEGFDEYLKIVREAYNKVVIRKPKASRPRSREVYILARGLKSGIT
jgi:23S rRNA (uridine2552-2'-O)-methyltransferase